MAVSRCLHFWKSGYVIVINVPASEYSTATLALEGKCPASGKKDDGFRAKEAFWTPLLECAALVIFWGGIVLTSCLGARMEQHTQKRFQVHWTSVPCPQGNGEAGL